MPAILPWIERQISDAAGVPLVGAKIYPFAANTVTPKVTYVDALGATPNTHPIVTDAAGRFKCFLAAGSYDFVVRSAQDVLQYTLEDISGGGSGSDGTLATVATMADLKALSGGAFDSVMVLGYYSSGDGGGGMFEWAAGEASADNIGTIIIPDSAPAAGRWLRIFTGAVNAKWFGVRGDGSTNDTVSMQSANTFVQSQTFGGDLFFPASSGRYLFSANLTFGAQVRVVRESGAIFASSGFTMAFPGGFESPKDQAFNANIGTITFSKNVNIQLEWWGVKGDGVTDNTAAIVSGFLSLQASGGGRIHYPPGNVLSHGGSLTTLADLSGISGISILGHKTTLTVNRTFVSTETVTFFKFTNCKNIEVDGFITASPEETSINRTDRGLIFIDLHEACENIKVTNIRQIGGKQFIHTETTNRALYRTRNIFTRNIFTQSVGYPINLPFSGDDSDIAYTCEKSYRAFHIYGVSHLKISVNSKDDSGTAILANYNSTMEDVDLVYHNSGSTLIGIAANLVELLAIWVPGGGPSQGPSIFRNIRVNMTVNCAQATYAARAFSIDKAIDGGGADGTERGHVFENITASGAFIGSGNNYVPIGVCSLGGGLWGTTETLRNLNFRNIVARDVNGSAINLSSLKDVAVFDNIANDHNMGVTGAVAGAAGKVLAVGVKSRIFWASAADTSDATLVRCEFTNLAALTNEAKTNKVYLDCLFYQSHIPSQAIRSALVAVEEVLWNKGTNANSDARRQTIVENNGGDPTTLWEIYDTATLTTILRSSMGLDNTDKKLKGSFSADPGVGPWFEVDPADLALTINGDFKVGALGKGIAIKEGANGRMGLAVLSGGAVTVNTNKVTANSRIFLTSNADGGTPGWPRVTARVVGVSFTITSASAADASSVAWEIKEPA